MEHVHCWMERKKRLPKEALSASPICSKPLLNLSCFFFQKSSQQKAAGKPNTKHAVQNLTQRRLVSPSNTRSLCPNRKLKIIGKSYLDYMEQCCMKPTHVTCPTNWTKSLQTLSATWGLSATINQSNLHSLHLLFKEKEKSFYLNRLADYLLLLLRASQQQWSNQTSIHQRLRWSYKQNRKQGCSNPIRPGPQL